MRDARAAIASAASAAGMPRPGDRWLQPFGLMQPLVRCRKHIYTKMCPRCNSLTYQVNVADLPATVAEPPRRSSRAPIGDAAVPPPPPLATAPPAPKRGSGQSKRPVTSPGDAAGVSGLRPQAKRSQRSGTSTANPPGASEQSNTSTADPPAPRTQVSRAGAPRGQFSRAAASVVRAATRLPEAAAAALASVAAARGLRPDDPPPPANSHGLNRSPLLSAAGTTARTLREVVVATQVSDASQAVEVAAAAARAEKERDAAGAERKARSREAEQQTEAARAAAQVEAKQLRIVQAQASEAARLEKQAVDRASELRAAAHRRERVESATAELQAFAGDLMRTEQQRIEQVHLARSS